MKHVIWILLLFVSISYASAQDVYTSSGKAGYHKKTHKKKGFDPDRLIIGGGLTLNFGDGYIAAGIAPMVGYRITDHFEAGIGLGYLYNQQPDLYFSNPPYTMFYDKENIIYPSLWARYFVWRGLYVTSQLEYDFINLNGPVDFRGDNVTSNVNATCLLLGAGAKFKIAGRTSFFIEVMYDVLQQPNSPYLNNIVPRAGIAVGL